MIDVAVTGFGLLVPSGLDAHAIAERADGILHGEGPPPGARVGAFDVEREIGAGVTYLDRASALGLVAVARALAAAGIQRGAAPSRRAGLFAATTFGCPETFATCCGTMQKKGMRFIQPLLFQHAFLNSADALCAIRFDLGGPNLNFCGGPVAGAMALHAAWDAVRRGRAELAVVLGADAVPDAFLRDDEKDAPAEGACAVVLEALPAARARGARVSAALKQCCVGGTWEAAHEATAMAEPEGTIGVALTEGRGLARGEGEAPLRWFPMACLGTGLLGTAALVCERTGTGCGLLVSDRGGAVAMCVGAC
jgi:3-oxoacyl-(acyl-carrier-protein) synthase